MRILQLSLVAAVLCPVLAAQQEWEIHPGVTNFTSRGTLGVNPGETLMAVNAAYWRGIGDNGFGKCVVSNFRGRLQDQNRSTIEFFHWVVRRGTDKTGPIGGKNNLIAKIGPFRTPIGGAAPGQFTMTTSLASPVRMPDCTSHFAVGLALEPAPGWVTDGLSTHMAVGLSTATLNHAQRTHAQAEDHAWVIAAGATQAMNAGNKRTWRYAMLLDNGVLQMCNGGGICGMGGMFPEATKPFSARCRYPASFGGGSSLLYLGTSRTNGVALLPDTTRLFLGGFVAFVSATTVFNWGEAQHRIVAALPAAVHNTGIVHFQAVGVKGPRLMMTNVHTVKP